MESLANEAVGLEWLLPQVAMLRLGPEPWEIA